MKNNKFTKKYFRKNWKNYIPFLFIIIISALPIFFTWGTLRIGGDVLIPFNYQGLEKFLRQWVDLQNGVYYYINYFPLYFLYRITDFLGLGIYGVSVFLLFIINLIAGLGVLKLVKLFYPKENWGFYCLPSFFYLLSPALLNGWHYLYVYSLIPWFIYFIFKVIKFNEIKITDVLWLVLILFFSSLDLPNPKYIFHLFFIALVIFILSLFLKIIRFNFFINNIVKFLLFFLLSFYLFLPLGFFASNYSPIDYGVNLKDGYKATGEMMDYGSTTMEKMFRLHHNNINLGNNDKETYLSNPIIIIASYIFIFIIVLSTLIFKGNFKSTKKNKVEIIFLVLIIIYLFFACGPNPPLGFVYEWMVTKISLFGFLRTTAGAVFYLSLFYSILLLFFIKKIVKRQIFIIIFLFILISIVGYPFLNGDFHKNYFSYLESEKNKRGFKIPNEYFRIKKVLDKKRIDAKMVHTRNSLSYIRTSWGYFGVIYNFLYKNSQLGNKDIYSEYNKHNVRFLFIDKSVDVQTEEIYFENVPSELIIKENFLEFNKIKNENFLPHFYTPTKNIVSNQSVEYLPEIVSEEGWEVRSAVWFASQNPNNYYGLEGVKGPRNNSSNFSGMETSTPVIEFKKINPTKYRVRVHGARGEFPVVFSESFHKGWRLYLKNINEIQNSKSQITNLAYRQAGKSKIQNSEILNEYKILDGNEGDQATKDEVREFIERGWVTSVGPNNSQAPTSFQENSRGKGLEGVKEIKHMKWNEEKQKEELDYIEKYKIDFISKNFQDTIQNDNLPKGNFWETWFRKPLAGERHLMVNGYANSWVVDVEAICGPPQKSDPKNNSSNFSGAGGASYCVQNADGSYDLELIVEFWPQRLFYIGVFVSGTTLLACLGYLGYDYTRNRNRRFLKGQGRKKVSGAGLSD